jgi:hypothetical protein
MGWYLSEQTIEWVNVLLAGQHCRLMEIHSKQPNSPQARLSFVAARNREKKNVERRSSEWMHVGELSQSRNRRRDPRPPGWRPPTAVSIIDYTSLLMAVLDTILMMKMLS